MSKIQIFIPFQLVNGVAINPVDDPSSQSPEDIAERQMWTVIEDSMHVIFKYIDYNTLLTRGVQCKGLVFNGITSIIERADEEAAKCSSAADPDDCYEDVTVRIGLRYRSGHVPIRTCINRAGMTITDEGIQDILESFIINTSSVVISEFKKDLQTLAATKEEGITDEVTDNSDTEEYDHSIQCDSEETQQGDENRGETEDVPPNDAQSVEVSIMPSADKPKSMDVPTPAVLNVKVTHPEEANPAAFEEAKSAKVAEDPKPMQTPVLLTIRPNDSNSSIVVEVQRTVTESVGIYITPQDPKEPKPLNGSISVQLGTENLKPEPIPAVVPKAAVEQPAH